ncbi:hypothetical protein NON00_21120 [Roseomonas sp. GC11]|uniref:hypothetical protein n=1 Tax=Roseomonas sp. GC11 TaxID=2950546 RepID=UPI00210E9E5D|nr:hypothetical protein [Roseomonas sp. GC11]MCQ4162418.1 hypothetical protein [Roseomonas sp. GC11]
MILEIENYADGSKMWFCATEKERKLHREDGPAVVCANGNLGWYIGGEFINEEVKCWMEENDFPNYTQWDDAIKVAFAMRFV